MNTRQFLRALAQGWRRFAGARLRGADLRGALLDRVSLRRADLRGARLGRADLTGADLRGANLRGADLTGADLTGADLRGAHIAGADWTDATLRDAHLDTGELSLIELQGGIRSMSGAFMYHRPETLLCQSGACPETGTTHCRVCTVSLCREHVRQVPGLGKVCPMCERFFHSDAAHKGSDPWLPLEGPDTPDM